MAGEAPSTKRRGDNPINTTRKQRALTPRKEPYWHSFRKGASVGLYVGTTRSEWRTRALGPDRKYKFKTLGAIEDLSYDDAVFAAMKFADAASSADRPNYTVRDAIADYTEHLLKTKGLKSADNAAGRLNKHVLPTLGNRTLADLRTQELNRWMRDTIPAAASERDQQRAKSTVNRTYSSFRAALNLAFREGIVSSDTEWRRVKSFPNADAARELFLTQAQVAALLDTSAGCFRDLVRAAVLTGARYGELGSAKVRDLDPQNGTLHLDGKTGPRDCHLGAEALTFFVGLARSKLPEAPLLIQDDGQPWVKGSQRVPFEKAIKRAGLPPEAVFYSLRHFHISRALLAGLPIQMIAENCGTSVAMITRFYGKFMQSDRRRLMDTVVL